MIFGGSNTLLKLGMKNHNRVNIPAMARPMLSNDAKIFIKSPYPLKKSVSYGLIMVLDERIELPTNHYE